MISQIRKDTVLVIDIYIKWYYGITIENNISHYYTMVYKLSGEPTGALA